MVINVIRRNPDNLERILEENMKSGQIKNLAREKLNGKYGIIIGIIFLSTLISFAIGGVSGAVDSMVSKVFGEGISIVGNFIDEILNIGVLFAVLKISRDKTPQVEDLFFGFQNIKRFAGIALVYTAISTVLSIPDLFLSEYAAIAWGIIASIIAVILTFYIALSKYLMIDDKELTVQDALEKSVELMRGHCIELFVLHLSFIGWCILGVISCGIGFLWIEPWMEVAVAIFYQNRISQNETIN